MAWHGHCDVKNLFEVECMYKQRFLSLIRIKLGRKKKWGSGNWWLDFIGDRGGRRQKKRVRKTYKMNKPIWINTVFLIRLTVYPLWGISEATEEYIGKTTTYINSVSATVTRYLWSPKNLIIMSITGKIQGV